MSFQRMLDGGLATTLAALLAAGWLAGDVSEAEADRVRLVDPDDDQVLYPININNWWTHMNRRGRIVQYPDLDWADYFYDNQARAVQDGLTGFLGPNGRWYREPQYELADRFSEGYAIVSDGQRYGYINKAHQEVYPMELDGALRFSEGYAAVQIGDRAGFIDQRGRMVIEPEFARVRSFREGLAMVQFPGGRGGEAGTLGYIDKRGRLVYRDDRGRFEDLGDFHDGLARAKVDGKWGFIGRRFQFRLRPRYEGAGDFVGGVAAVKLEGRWGYIDKTGRLVVEPRYEQAEDFDEGLAMVREGGKFGYVDRTGRRAIRPQFEDARPFFRRYARVSAQPYFTYVDRSGRQVWDVLDPRVILDRRIQAQIYQRREPPSRGTRRLAPPSMRAAIPEPYPPDYLYEPELPYTQHRRGRGPLPEGHPHARWEGGTAVELDEAEGPRRERGRGQR